MLRVVFYWMANGWGNLFQVSAVEPTPSTTPGAFERVRGTPARLNAATGEVWDPDRLHKDHWEVYSSRKDYENGRRNRAVWNDGRLKEKF